jgi:predicted enzyme related to lactoylglutathione lyase
MVDQHDHIHTARTGPRSASARCAATVYVKRLESMAAFYEACCGLKVVDVAPGDYVLLESATVTLSLVQVPPEVGATITIAVPSVRREGSPIKLTFDVPSIDSVRPAIINTGGQVGGVQWEFRGFLHCDFIDPEGNVVQLREAKSPEANRY